MRKYNRQDDVFVVAPSNMGKGLAYNETVKQYEVNARDANSVNLIPDRRCWCSLSKDAGNAVGLRVMVCMVRHRPLIRFMFLYKVMMPTRGTRALR